MIEPLSVNFEKTMNFNGNDINAINTINTINGITHGIVSNHNQDNISGAKQSSNRRFNYLNNLLKIQCLFGVTYCGNTFVDFDKRLTIFWKACLVCYDLFLIVVFMAFEYFALTDETYRRTFGSSQQNKMIMNIVFTLAGFAMAIEFSVVKLLALLRGKTIISTLMAFGKYGKSRHLRQSLCCQFEYRMSSLFDGHHFNIMIMLLLIRVE